MATVFTDMGSVYKSEQNQRHIVVVFLGFFAALINQTSTTRVTLFILVLSFFHNISDESRTSFTFEEKINSLFL